MSPLLLIALACAPSDAPVGDDADSSVDPDPSADSEPNEDSEPGPDSDDADATVAVAHRRELRALYVATVFHIDWPSRSGLAAAAQRAEIAALLDAAAAARLNAVVVQLRPEGDALYASSLEPWSRFLTGTQGGDPGYDPLAVWLDEAHARGLEVHGWINPYRARAGSTSRAGLAPGHAALDFPEHAHAYGTNLWMDPGARPVRDRVVAVVTDLVSRYPIDGIHLDDYFYPYATEDPFPDDLTWDAYVARGGTLGRDDWRRSNTAALVAAVADAVRDVDPAIRFGVAPFGIWRPGHPEGIEGLDAYATLYADPLAWARAGDVDYVAPQLYWETTRTAQAFGPLARWWNDQLPDGVALVPAHALYKLGTAASWTLDELGAQVAIGRDPTLDHAAGGFWYNASPLRDDAPGLRAAFADAWYPTPALPPAVPGVADLAVPPPEVEVGVDERVVWTPSPTVRGLTVYRSTDDGWVLDRIVPDDEGGVALPAGRWALAAVGVGDVESRGVVVDVR